MWSVLCLLSCLGRVPAPLCTSVLAWPTSDAKVCHCFSLVLAQQWRINIAQLLLGRDANIGAATEDGKAALHHSVERGRTDTI